MGKEKMKEETVIDCPAARFFRDLEKAFGKKSKFFDHLTRSRVEFLKGVRAFIDERIEELEKKGKKDQGKKITKIEVED
ncbi:MAG: hypothetical protein JRI80_18040 [Deltaproteobacteria bacterium]|nr:hypothetical protein [Deltaproteobacteria bacterium]